MNQSWRRRELMEANALEPEIIFRSAIREATIHENLSQFPSVRHMGAAEVENELLAVADSRPQPVFRSFFARRVVAKFGLRKRADFLFA
jgi:hypothetical protein